MDERGEAKREGERDVEMSAVREEGPGRGEERTGCELYSNDEERHTKAKNDLELPILNTLPMYNP